MIQGTMYIPSLEDYAKIKKVNTVELLACEECKFCRMGVNACIFGNKVRNLDYIEVCPRVKKFL